MSAALSRLTLVRKVSCTQAEVRLAIVSLATEARKSDACRQQRSAAVDDAGA